MTTLTQHPPPNADALQAGAERLLQDAADRALRAPKGKLAVALHLSRLKTQAAAPYHARIALALMQDTAQRLGGQVFPMRNTDLVLLCAAPGAEAGQPRPATMALIESLERLFAGAAPGAALTSTWRLEDASSAFQDYLAQRQAEPPAASTAHAEAPHPGSLATLLARMQAADLRTMLVQQTAVALQPGRFLPVSARLSPLFREVSFTPAALLDGMDAAFLADPFIQRHVAGVLEPRILALLRDDLAQAGPLTRPALRLDMPVNLNLTPSAIISPAFARLAQAAAACGARIAVELQAADIAADPDLAAFACRLLSQAGFTLVLDGIDHAGLAMICPSAFNPALIKLVWSPRLADAPPAQLARIDAAIAAIGPAKILLMDSGGEAALIWGQSRHINQFQGPYMDAVQAASRIGICHSARACTLRQCTARALALDHATRGGCGNPALLDMPAPVAAPEPLRARA